MPFDGSEFYGATRSPTLSDPPAGARRPVAAWLRLVLLGAAGPEAWARLPARPAPDPEIPALQLLQAARALIASEDAWVQGAYHTPAGRHCAIGALRAVAARLHAHGGGRGGKMKAHTLLLTVARQRGFDSVETMNDRSSHAQVLDAFDAAIASARLRAPAG